MRIWIAGIDGYLGWTLAKHLALRGHEIGGADNYFRREWVRSMGSWSATPIEYMQTRVEAFKKIYGKTIEWAEQDLRRSDPVAGLLREFKPDAVVQLGECPSAPYSMMSAEKAMFVQTNNISTTFSLLFALRDHFPDAHLLKLGTMGEYGTPSVPIPEGFFDLDYRGHQDRLPFPRQPGSFYHAAKVHTSVNVELACKLWHLRATDIMQGVVFGTRATEEEEEEALLTRLDFDQAFGTVVNRYCCQAVIGDKLTPFGKGHQRRGFLPLRDSMQCLTLALENPPKAGEYRVFNQFEEVYDITDLAFIVQEQAVHIDREVEVAFIENPRQEAEDHFYEPDHQHLLDLGYQPTTDIASEIRIMLEDLRWRGNRIRARRAAIHPDLRWDGQRKKVACL